MKKNNNINFSLDQFMNLVTSCFSSVKFAKQRNRTVLCWINTKDQTHNASILEVSGGAYVLYDFREDKSYNAWALIREFHHLTDKKEIFQKLCYFTNSAVPASSNHFEPFEKTSKESNKQELFEYAQKLYSAVPANKSSIYLQQKQIDHLKHNVYGLKVLHDQSLIIPVYNSEFEIQAYQYIKHREHKRFYGAIKNGFIAITDDLNNLKTADKIGLCEGFAKGLAIAGCVDYPVVVGLSAFNIKNAMSAVKSINKGVSFKLFGDHNSAGLKSYFECKEIDSSIEFTMIDDMSKDYDDLFIEDIEQCHKVVHQNRFVNSDYLDVLKTYKKENIISVHQQYLDKSNYLSIKNVPTAFVKSSYGTAKNTNMIHNICDDNQKVIFITHRISLANKAISQLYDLGFVSYLDIDDRIIDNTVNKLIIGIKSFHRFSKYFDFSDYVVVVDELDQVLVDIENHNDDTLIKINENKQRMLKTCKQFFGLSAGISKRDITYISRFRDIEKSKLFINHYVKGGIDCIIYQQKTEFMNQLEHDLILLNAKKSNDKIFIYSNSIQKTKELASLVDRKYSFIRYKLINSENTDQLSTKQFLANITDESNNYDLIIASPSVNTGIDLNNKKYNKIYLYINDKTMLLDDHLQALARCRQAKIANIYLPDDSPFDVASAVAGSVGRSADSESISIQEIKKKLLANHIREIFKPSDFASYDEMITFLHHFNENDINAKYQHEIEFSHDLALTRTHEQKFYKSMFLNRLEVLNHNIIFNDSELNQDNGSAILQDIALNNQIIKHQKIDLINACDDSENMFSLSKKHNITTTQAKQIIDTKKSIEKILNILPVVHTDDDESSSVPAVDVSESKRKELIELFLQPLKDDQRVKNLDSAIQSKKQKLHNYLYLTNRLAPERKYRKLALHSENLKFTDSFVLQHWLVFAYELMITESEFSIEQNKDLILYVLGYQKEIKDLLDIDLKTIKDVSKYLRSQFAGAGISFIRRKKDLQHFVDVTSVAIMDQLTQYVDTNKVTKLHFIYNNNNSNFVTCGLEGREHESESIPKSNNDIVISNNFGIKANNPVIPDQFSGSRIEQKPINRKYS